MVEVLDSFEDGDISEYSGDTDQFNTSTDFATDGSLSLEVGASVSAITRTDVSITQGETPFGCDKYTEDVGDLGTIYSRSGILFGVQSETGADSLSAYAAIFGNDEVGIYRYDNGSETTLKSESISADENSWYVTNVKTWDSNGNIEFEIINKADDTVVKSISATDTTYSSGGFGFIVSYNDGGYIDRAFRSTPLQPPSNVTVADSSTKDELTLDWTEADGAAGYYVYRAESSGSTVSDYTQVADVTAPPYTDTGLEDGEKYYYRVSSHD